MLFFDNHFNFCFLCSLRILLVLDLKADKLYVGDDANAECTLTMDDEVMVSLGNGSLTTQDAVSQGKLSIDGSLDLALKLSPFVSSL